MEFLLSHLGDLITAAHAQGPCVGVDCGVGGNPLPFFITVAAALLLEVASGLSVLFVVIGGAHMVLNFGDESQATKGRKAIIYSLIGFALALSSQAIVSFTVARAGLVTADAPHLGIMRVTLQSILIILNVSFAFLLMFFGYKLVIARGQQSELDSAKQGVVWAIIGALAVNLAYALVRATALLGF